MSSFKNSLLFQGTRQSTELSVFQSNPILHTWVKAADVDFCLDCMASNPEVLDRQWKSKMLIQIT